MISKPGLDCLYVDPQHPAMSDPNHPDPWQNIITSVAGELHEAGFLDATEIGRGGFGVVFRCQQTQLQRTVAVKVLTAVQDPDNLERFFREQHAMGRLTGHPNIVHIFQVDITTQGHPYIVMEYHPMGSLADRIRKDGPLSWENTLQLGVKIAGALETAHRLEILHRDVKPGNILLSKYGEPQLTDFGISHITGEFQTERGIVTGSPAFTAPEILRGDHANPASDVYSLGATLFYAITGQAAFEHRPNEPLTIDYLRTSSIANSDPGEPILPADLRECIQKAMLPTPGSRPATAGQLGEELREIQKRNTCHVDGMVVIAKNESGHHPSQKQGVQHPEPGRAGWPQDSLSPVTQPKESAPDHTRWHQGWSNPGKLPLELTSFVNRRHELLELRRLLSDSRLVTLTGIGGVGKTRLALRVAQDCRRAFKHGVCLTELADLQDPELLPQIISASIGLQDRNPDPPAKALIAQLMDRDVLLVWDNCERIIGAVAALAEPVLQSCPGVRIVATSREPLGILGETVVRVSPLRTPEKDGVDTTAHSSLNECITLFQSRAAASVPDFKVSKQNITVVSQICRRLEGLPLPIELAASLLRVMSAEQILNNLDNRLDLLGKGGRGKPSRQKTLRSCIDWSYETCSHSERQLWLQLSIFTGGFEFDAAETILAGEPDHQALLDSLTGLVDKSILTREQSGPVVRYRLLDILRDYGREKLTDFGLYTEMRRKHLHWCAKLLTQAETEWMGPHQVDWLSRLDRELPNLREALEASCLESVEQFETGIRIGCAMYQYWWVRGLFNEGRYWLNRLLSRRSQAPADKRIEALCDSSILAMVQSDNSAAIVTLDEARGLELTLDEPVPSGLVAFTDGIYAFTSDDQERALADFQKAAGIFRAENVIVHLVAALTWQAYILSFAGRVPEANEKYIELFALTDLCEESLYRGMAMTDYGLFLWQHGNRRQCIEVLRDSLRISQRVRNQFQSAWCLEELAWTAVETQPKTAAVLLGAADAVFLSTGSSPQTSGYTRDFDEACRRQARLALGNDAFESALGRGNSMSTDEAIAFTLDEKPRAANQTAAGEAQNVALTRREKEVAKLVATGLSNKAIARKLMISQRTAEGHVERILVKLGFNSRTQIALWINEDLAN
ncbi:protein kinase [Nocardia africana]|uniref:Protein kinase n=1 Tax=Nocardia africana TaxID=134964 RepID=A0ABW6NE62_9NOCA